MRGEIRVTPRILLTTFLNRLEERAYSDEIGRLLLRPLCILPRAPTKMQPFRGSRHLPRANIFAGFLGSLDVLHGPELGRNSLVNKMSGDGVHNPAGIVCLASTVRCFDLFFQSASRAYANSQRSGTPGLLSPENRMD